MLSYPIVEHAGGPAAAVAGFSRGLAALGAKVTVLAIDSRKGNWLIDENSAQADGLTFRKVPRSRFAAATLWEARRISRKSPNTPTVIWVNGIWGQQSAAGALAAKLTSCPLIIRPAGSLGKVAREYKSFKKRLYYSIVEKHALNMSAIHCMSSQEIAELPGSLQSRAFLAPSGVEPASPLPLLLPSAETPKLIGVLARIHPIKRHHLVLDAAEQLIKEGVDLRVEFAGNVSSADYFQVLRQRVDRSDHLANRVRFLGHVPSRRVTDTVSRWSASVLPSEQENLGHALLVAASAGVPSIVSSGVAIAKEIATANAGTVANNAKEIAAAIRKYIQPNTKAVNLPFCLSFARQHSWESCSLRLHKHIQRAIAETP